MCAHCYAGGEEEIVGTVRGSLTASEFLRCRRLTHMGKKGDEPLQLHTRSLIVFITKRTTSGPSQSLASPHRPTRRTLLRPKIIFSGHEQKERPISIQDYAQLPRLDLGRFPIQNNGFIPTQAKPLPQPLFNSLLAQYALPTIRIDV